MIELSMSLIPSPLTRPVLDGRAPVEGADTHPEAARSVNTNSLEMLDLKFDVAEMSLATFTKAREQGVPLVALPIFTGRRFLHPGITLAASAAISDLSALRGRRVGLPQFWMTSSVWHRLVLRQVYGVAQSEVSWVTTAPERMGSLGLPPEARLDTTGRSPRDLLLAGEVDAVMAAGGGGARGDGAGERVQGQVAPSPLAGEGGDGGERRAPSPLAGEGGDGGEASRRGIVPAFPDPVTAQREYYERTGIFPIMHLIVMTDELASRDPELVERLCDAFQQGKEMALAEALDSPSERPIPGLAKDQTRTLFGDDPWPYGIGPNRKVLDLFLADVRDQGLIDRSMLVEDLFPSSLAGRYR